MIVSNMKIWIFCLLDCFVLSLIKPGQTKQYLSIGNHFHANSLSKIHNIKQQEEQEVNALMTPESLRLCRVETVTSTSLIHTDICRMCVLGFVWVCVCVCAWGGVVCRRISFSQKDFCRDKREHSDMKQSDIPAITNSCLQVSACVCCCHGSAVAVSVGKCTGAHAEGAFLRLFGAAGVKELQVSKCLSFFSSHLNPLCSSAIIYISRLQEYGDGRNSHSAMEEKREGFDWTLASGRFICIYIFMQTNVTVLSRALGFSSLLNRNGSCLLSRRLIFFNFGTNTGQRMHQHRLMDDC